MKRRLTLKSEHLTELTTAEMSAVGAAQGLPTLDCITPIILTIDTPCPTVQPCIYIERTPLCPTEV